ncbi:MAG: hypothetical protein HY861_04530 [Chlamydiia bacterium]|nr:hypothetical protein [Chlamydiia bacterium]
MRILVIALLCVSVVSCGDGGSANRGYVISQSHVTPEILPAPAEADAQ